jgi:hypothetical protein
LRSFVDVSELVSYGCQCRGNLAARGNLQRPPKLELIFSLKTLKVLDLAVPPSTHFFCRCSRQQVARTYRGLLILRQVHLERRHIPHGEK